jgi:Ca-activated chloride channel homolog
MTVDFAWPWATACLPLPLIIYWLLPRASRQEAALRVPFFDLVTGFESSTSVERKSYLRRLLMVLIWCALVLAATRPQFVGEPIELPTTGRDLMLAVDISGSMGTEDMLASGRQVSRLAVVKAVVSEFVERRKGDRLGLILFGSHAYLQTPLTFDRLTVRTLLMETPLRIAGDQTAIGDAIGLAVKRLLTRPASNRVLILLTDGRNNAGEVAPLQAGQIAAEQGVKIYTVGFGADEMRVPGLFFDRTVNPSAELDEATLTQIATLTGGLYQRARDATELAQIYEALDQLEPIEQEKETYRPTKSLFAWPLGFAFILTLLMGALHPLVTSWILSLIPARNAAEAEAKR